MKPLLIVRPEPAARVSLERARARGLDARSFPLFETMALAWEVPDPKAYTGLLITSANAVRLSGDGLTQLLSIPVFAVGEASAAAARDAGFVSLITGDADVTRLLARLATLGPQKLLHLCGADYVEVDLAMIEIDRRTVYQASALEPPQELLTALSQPAVIMLHSPRAASRIAAICDRHHIDRSLLSIAAISANAAQAAGAGWQKLAIAAKPRDDDILSVAEILCRQE